MAEVGDLLGVERAFALLEHQAVFAQLLEYRAGMVKMFNQCHDVDEYVVEEDENEVTKEGAHDVVHHGLERGRCVREPEHHHHELEVAVMGAERRLGDVVSVHEHLVVPAAHVQLGEEAGHVARR